MADHTLMMNQMHLRCLDHLFLTMININPEADDCDGFLQHTALSVKLCQKTQKCSVNAVALFSPGSSQFSPDCVCCCIV